MDYDWHGRLYGIHVLLLPVHSLHIANNGNAVPFEAKRNCHQLRK